MHKTRLTITAGIAGGVLSLAAMTAASATPAPAHTGKPLTSTPGCEVIFSPSCVTPVVAQASIGSEDLIPADDFGLTYQGPSNLTGVAYGNIGWNFDNNLGNDGTAAQLGTQDFSWDVVDTVPSAGPGAYGFTPFDNVHYAGDPVVTLRYVPNGVDSGLCPTISSKTRPNGLVLGICTSNIRQALIVAKTAPGLAPLAGPTAAYYYVFQAAQSNTDAQHHLALLDPHPGSDDALAASGTPLHVAAGLASLDELTAIP